MENNAICPLISVVTVVYNARDLIEKTICSVLGQTYKNIEFIMIDGGSTDGTLEIVEKYRSRINSIISEPDRGIYDAMNKALKLTTGDWVSFMNAGDVFYKNTAVDEVFKDHIYTDDVIVIYGDVVMDAGDNNLFIKHFDKLDKDKVPFSLNHQSTFTQGDVIRDLGFDTSYKIAADANLFNSIFKRGYSFRYVPVIVSVYESVAGVSSTNPIALFKEYARIRNISIRDYAWWYGYIRAQFFYIIGLFPLSISKRIMALVMKLIIK